MNWNDRVVSYINIANCAFDIIVNSEEFLINREDIRRNYIKIDSVNSLYAIGGDDEKFLLFAKRNYELKICKAWRNIELLICRVVNDVSMKFPFENFDSIDIKVIEFGLINRLYKSINPEWKAYKAFIYDMICNHSIKL